ncbi:hypothetical protein [Mycobacteroides abscessus]|uniref:hypothetical protein n=1 Tax=Mycobacteroides abscessus TaxID=36809 RepID=UPI001A9879DE|nr:hypothetical protein [Mycobacteroides abscessus]
MRRVRGRDLLNPIQRFVLQPDLQQAPAAATDRPVQPTLLHNIASRPVDRSFGAAGHGPHIEGLDRDRLEAAGDSGQRANTAAFLNRENEVIDF